MRTREGNNVGRAPCRRRFRLLLAAACLGSLAPGPGAASAGQPEDAATAPAASAEDKLLRLTTPEDDFRSAWRSRTLRELAIGRNEGRLEDLKGDSEAARKRGAAPTTALDVIFAAGDRREYEFNPVTSTVSLKVTAAEVE